MISEENRLKLKNQMPECFSISSAMDYPEEKITKVRGYVGKWSIIIEWLYEELPDTVYLIAYGIDAEEKRGDCPLDKLGQALSSLS